jgi:hypothetical protein
VPRARTSARFHSTIRSAVPSATIAAATATEIGDGDGGGPERRARAVSDGDVARNPVRYPAATLFKPGDVRPRPALEPA